MADSDLIIALSKGRILKETLPLLKHAGIELLEDPDESRKLIFDTTKSNVKVIIIRATDVPPFVESGAADIGVSGKDVLMEYGSNELYEPVDLQIARCKLMVAGIKGAEAPTGRARVATKFINITRKFFAGKGQQVDLIKLYGSMELAPLVGMADYIVDIVDTGNTLRENGLEPVEMIAPVSSRLIVNKAAMKLKFDSINPVVTQISEAVSS